MCRDAPIKATQSLSVLSPPISLTPPYHRFTCISASKVAAISRRENKVDGGEVEGKIGNTTRSWQEMVYGIKAFSRAAMAKLQRHVSLLRVVEQPGSFRRPGSNAWNQQSWTRTNARHAARLPLKKYPNRIFRKQWSSTKMTCTALSLKVLFIVIGCGVYLLFHLLRQEKWEYFIGEKKKNDNRAKTGH